MSAGKVWPGHDLSPWISIAAELPALSSGQSLAEQGKETDSCSPGPEMRFPHPLGFQESFSFPPTLAGGALCWPRQPLHPWAPGASPAPRPCQHPDPCRPPAAPNCLLRAALTPWQLRAPPPAPQRAPRSAPHGRVSAWSPAPRSPHGALSSVSRHVTIYCHNLSLSSFIYCLSVFPREDFRAV